MNHDRKGPSEPIDIEAAFRDGKVIDQALRRGVRAALRRHKQLGESIVVWQDGRVVEIPAEEIEIEPDDPE